MAIELTSANFDATAASGVVLIDFSAEWCGPCHEMAPVIDEIEREYQGRAKVCKVDVDSEQKLAVRFRIMNIPTIFVLKDGKLVNQFVGITGKADLEAAIRKAEGIA